MSIDMLNSEGHASPHILIQLNIEIRYKLLPMSFLNVILILLLSTANPQRNPTRIISCHANLPKMECFLWKIRYFLVILKLKSDRDSHFFPIYC